MKEFILFLFLAFSLSFALANFNKSFARSEHDISYNYKITAYVETPEGIKSGYAVRNITSPPLLKLSNKPVKISGEAVIINLGLRGYLFLIVETNDEQIIFNTIEGPPGLTAEGIKFYKVTPNLSGVVHFNDYPRIVMFKDIKNPKTVQEVYETETFSYTPTGGGYKIGKKLINDNFEALFGAGVRLLEVKIEITEEPVTRKIISLLPWLIDYYDQRFDGDRSSSFAVNAPISNQLSASHFSR